MASSTPGPAATDDNGTPLNRQLATNRPLPGAVSFLRENGYELSARRDQLATELTEYLTRQPRDPQHVRQVLGMALESAADQAHRAAMAAEPSTAFHVMPPAQTDLSQLNFEMAETRRMIIQTRQELQQTNESLQFLSRHLQQEFQPTEPPARRRPVEGVAWESRLTPTLPVVSEMDRIHELQQQVRQLEHQLQSCQTSPANQSRAEQRLAASWSGEGQLQPAAWESKPLRPWAETQQPFRPVPLPAEQRTWRHYYVGDLIAPPVASSTLRLMQHLKSKIAPDSWLDESIQITAPAVSLLILQTPQNHQQIESLLREMGGMLK